MCNHMASMDWQTASKELEHCMFTGLAVSYARSFGQNNGLASISSKFERFADPALKETHDRLISSRNEIYAHKDTQAELGQLTPQGQREVSKIEIDINDKGETYWMLQRVGFHMDFLQHVKKLCEFQCERINVASTEMLVHFLTEKTYLPGRYVLGETFP